MATRLSGTAARDNMRDALKTAFTSVFDFKSIDGYKLYITDNIYIEVGEHGDLNVYKGNLSVCAIDFNWSGNYSWEVVKSASGDVAFRVSEKDSALVDGQGLGVVIAKAKNVLTGADTYGVYVPINRTTQTVKYFITDDTSQLTETTGIYQNGGSTSVSAYCIWNPAASISSLISVCAVSSACVCESLKIMQFGPREYYGECLVNNKSYYSFGQVMMLDEEE